MQMTKPQLIRLIHVAKNQFKLDDETYCQLLLDLTGKTSCSKMALADLEKVYQSFKDKGFKRKFKKENTPAVTAAHHRTDIQKIKAIWITMSQQGFITDSSDKALNSYVCRMTKTSSKLGIKNAAWLDTHSASCVLESIKKWHLRVMIDRFLQYPHFHLVGQTLHFRTQSYKGYTEIATFYQDIIDGVKAKERNR